MKTAAILVYFVDPSLPRLYSSFKFREARISFGEVRVLVVLIVVWDGEIAPQHDRINTRPACRSDFMYIVYDSYETVYMYINLQLR